MSRNRRKLTFYSRAFLIESLLHPDIATVPSKNLRPRTVHCDGGDG